MTEMVWADARADCRRCLRRTRTPHTQLETQKPWQKTLRKWEAEQKESTEKIKAEQGRLDFFKRTLESAECEVRAAVECQHLSERYLSNQEGGEQPINRLCEYMHMHKVYMSATHNYKYGLHTLNCG